MDIEQLIQAVQSLRNDDAFRPRLDLAQWRSFSNYLALETVRPGSLVIRQGEVDRSAYLLGSGSLQVYVEGAFPGTTRAVMLRPGSLVGEVGLFSAGPRTAQVEAMTSCDLWVLRLPRFEEMCMRQPQLAVEVTRAAGAVMAVRLRTHLQNNLAVA
jgi:CRP-like cAMP-binding protein